MASYFERLTTSNSGVSTKSFFLVIMTIIGGILLLIPAVILMVELFRDGGIKSDYKDLSVYIGAVVGIFATGGVTKAWCEHTEHKHRKLQDQSQDGKC